MSRLEKGSRDMKRLTTEVRDPCCRKLDW